ncbi:GNAT family N-acetyltransferase [Streptococcus sp. SO4]|uniref:GNAT family N-acetyltransferase n=1 Tax=Streptococcus sp. SO4 TaxID=3018249 RepID=UPI00263C907E|nr:GNAT family N-acetyltransferase [Streptococcus sp. SO4]MDN5024430.1 GNAT family N-acetyltransferase [Streptococcus sp. SO4]
MKTTCSIRKMQKSDIKDLSRGFMNQGWPGREEILARYFLEQESGEREVLVAEVEGAVAGYITILPSAKHGPFAEVYPELSDFNVFEPFRNQGVGNQLLEEAEKRVKLVSIKVSLGVGLHSGYGPAQRLYIKRGYIPDGTGVWYRNHPLEMNATSQNNDDLVLYLSKEFE